MTIYMPTNSSNDNVSVPTAPVRQNEVNSTTFPEHHLLQQQPIPQNNVYGNNPIQLNPYLNPYNGQLYHNTYDQYGYQYQNTLQGYTNNYGRLPMYSHEQLTARAYPEQPSTQPEQFPPNTNDETSYVVKDPNRVKINLEDAQLWENFNSIGTEMIITKSGRRIFPPLRVSLTGLDPNAKYMLAVDVLPFDDNRYKYNNNSWILTGKAEPQMRNYPYFHPDCPMTGAQLMKQPISFKKLKVTNNPSAQGQIVLNSLHKYKPRISILKYNDMDRSTVLMNSVIFRETSFIAVTAYQNEAVTNLKIDHNPFAKGFRETNKRSRGAVKRDYRSMNEQVDANNDMRPQQSKRSRVDDFEEHRTDQNSTVTYLQSPSMIQPIIGRSTNNSNSYMLQHGRWN